MRRKTPPLISLRAFEAAARHQSITRAAEELCVTPGAVSQQITNLEANLGIALFNRIKQRLELTAAGMSYLGPIKQSFDHIESATQDLLHYQGLGGDLRVGVLPSLASVWLIPRLPDFAKAHPTIRLNLSTLNVNFASDERSPNLEGGHIDIGLFYGDGHWENLASELLLPEVLVPVVASSLIDKEEISDPEIFNRLPLLEHTTRPNSWAEWFILNNFPIQKPRGFGFEHFQMVVDAAKGGLGIAIAPRMFVQEDINTGLLREMPGYPLKSKRAYYIVYEPSSREDAKIQSFKSWLLDAAQENNI